MKFNLLKRERAGELVLTMMIWAILSLLTTRLFINIFDGPQIAFGQWHIAHVLWGGILMAIGMVLVLGFYGEKVRRLAAAVAGIGWGLFADEIGKYLTKSNDYWFQPAVIFIYISFILLFLVYRYFERKTTKSQRCLMYAILEDLEQVAENDLEKTEKKGLLRKLRRVNTDLAKAIRKVVLKIKPIEDRSKRGMMDLIIRTPDYIYRKLFSKKFVVVSLAVYSVYFSVDKLVDLVTILLSPQKLATIQKFYVDYDLFSKADTYMIGLKIFFDVVAAILFLVGWWWVIRKKKRRGIRFFELGLLVNIFLGAVFKFYFEQFSAVVGLLINMVLWEILGRYRGGKT